MSPRTPAVVLAAALALACNRASPERAQQGAQASAPSGTATPGPGVSPGLYAGALIGPLTNPFTGDARAIRDGRRMFNGFNCSGCHSGYAGGGMGPNLRDTVWVYGSTDADLYSTIAEGRPNGMPAWGGRIPEEQIWQIIAYLRTLGTDDEPEKPPTPTRTTSVSAEQGTGHGQGARP